jgi:TetR/AcrR family transcriptional regulator, transcriptional repressor for nem operon
MHLSESRERLIAAAADLFLGGGFHNVGIAQICDTAHINKGTFYHFFPSKIDLLIEVMDRYVKDVAVRFREIADSSDPPAAKVLRLYGVPEGKNREWQRELAASEPVVRDKARWAMNLWTQAMRPIVDELKEAEGIGELDATAAASALLGIMQGAQVMAKAKNDVSIFPQYGALALEMVRGAGRAG